jgi:hypothetical protein
METKDELNMIAEFIGYVKTPVKFNVQLHSSNFGFKGTNGRTNLYVEKSQYDLLMNAFLSKDFVTIDNFYKKEKIEYSYLFDGDPNHLFLSAYKNRTTNLDCICAQFNSSWELIMIVVKLISERIRGGITYDLRDALLRADKEEVYKEIVSIIEWYNKKHKS